MEQVAFSKMKSYSPKRKYQLLKEKECTIKMLNRIYTIICMWSMDNKGTSSETSNGSEDWFLRKYTKNTMDGEN